MGPWSGAAVLILLYTAGYALGVLRTVARVTQNRTDDRWYTTWSNRYYAAIRLGARLAPVFKRIRRIWRRK